MYFRLKNIVLKDGVQVFQNSKNPFGEQKIIDNREDQKTHRVKNGGANTR